jgi:hypothetical protein
MDAAGTSTPAIFRSARRGNQTFAFNIARTPATTSIDNKKIEIFARSIYSSD